MKLLAIIVACYPDAEVLKRNIGSFINYVDQLLIWDNTPERVHPEQAGFAFLKDDKIHIYGNGQNEGIGYALNQGVRYAAENGFTHLLTMDQDSHFSGETFASLVHALGNPNDPMAAGIAPYTYIQELTPPPGKEVKEITKTFDIITSGTIYTIEALKKNGCFRDDFFIDAIDTEYNLRIKKNGYHFLRIPEAVLLHRLGSIEMKKTRFRTIRCFNYSPMRCYYFARNHYIVCSAYPSAKRWFFYWKSFFYRNLSVVLFECGKRKKTGAYFRGLYDGIRRKTGICKRYHR